MGQDETVSIGVEAEVEQAIKDFKRTGEALEDMGDGAAQAETSYTNLSSVIVGLNQGVELLNHIVEAAKAIHEETVGVYIEYADQVREIMRITGENSKETSKLMQVADNVGISYGNLKTLMVDAAKNGIDMTTDSLKSMSEEYLTLAPGTERMRYLVEKFGETGAEMGKLLEQGAEGLDRLNASVQKGAILSEGILKQARAHEILTDMLNDEITTKKILAGIELGSLEDSALLLRAAQERIRVMKEEEELRIGRNFTYQEYMRFFEENIDTIKQQIAAEVDAQIAYEDTGNKIAGLLDLQDEYAKSLDDVAAAQKRLEEIQRSWSEGTGGEVAGLLSNLNMNNQDYMEGLAAIDEILGTSVEAEQIHKDALKEMIDQYYRSRDVDAFKNALANLKDSELPKTTEELDNARGAAEGLEGQIAALKEMAKEPITFHVVIETSGNVGLLHGIPVPP